MVPTYVHFRLYRWWWKRNCTRLCTRLVCKQRFISAQSVMGHTDTPQYSPYCGTLLQLHFPVSNFMTIYLHFEYRISWKYTISIFRYRISWKSIHYLHFPVSNFMKVCSLSPFSSIEIHDCSLSPFPVSNFKKVCSLSPFSTIEFHESLFIISVFRYRISRKCAHCFLMLLRDIIEDTDVLCALRVFLHLLAGMAPKLAGCDVVYTKYTEILWKPLKQFRR